MNTRLFLLIGSAAACAAAATIGQTDAVAASASHGSQTLVTQKGADSLPCNNIERTPHGVEYVTGGIGVGCQKRLSKMAQEQFNLKLVFTLNEGNYVADVNVAMKDASGNTVVQDVADGPYFIVNLPPGRYTVTARYEGKTVTRTVHVGKGLHAAYLRWPSNPETDFVLPPAQRAMHAGTAALPQS